MGNKNGGGGIDHNLIEVLIKSNINSVTNDNAFSRIPKEIINLYIINYKIRNKILSIDEAVKFLDGVRINFDKYNRNSVIFIFTEIFNYFENINEWSFFVKARGNINHILKVRFINYIGSKIYYKKFTQIFNKYYLKDIKVAIMISGAFRGHYKHCLKAAVNLAESINGDIFIYSWDKLFCYPGLGGAAGNYVNRNFSSIMNDCPDLIKNKAGLRKHFPNVFEILNQEYCEPLDKNEFLKYSNTIKVVVLENDENFQKNIIDNYIDKIKNISQDQFDHHFGIYFTNVCKQFYLLDKCCQIMINYEKKHHFKYDYIIRIRPDSIPQLLSTSELLKIQPSEIALRWVGGIEVDDAYLYGRRNEMLQFCNIYDFNKKQEFNYFLNMFNMGGIHGMLSNWIILNNLEPIETRLLGKIENRYHVSYLPNFDKELQIDIKNSQLNDEQLKACIIFFDKIKHLINQNNETMREQNNINQQVIGTAKSRIKNQLSYKLGQAIVGNRGLLGYIKMPFVLSYIYDEYKKDQLAYQDKIKKNPKLKLPKLQDYPDYKEALKIKDSLEFKLGEAFIKVSKNWYKGGFIKFIFDIKRLK